MQPLSGNQRPDLLTVLMNMSLVLRLPRKIYLCRSSSNVPRLPSFLKRLQNLQSLLTFGRVQNPVQKWYEHVVFLACWIRNVLRATTGCTFSTSQLSKELRHWSLFAHFGFEMCFAPQRRALFQKLNFLKAPRIVFTILTSKRAPCHNSVHLFHISTSKSAPDARCFVHFYFQMCFAPQRRAILHFSSA